MYFPLFVGFCVCSLFCYALLSILSSFAIILTGKRELVALLQMATVLLTVLWYVIVVFPDHSHLLLAMIFLFYI